jgi:cell division protein FtsI (penicillin-binding protein 3)
MPRLWALNRRQRARLQLVCGVFCLTWVVLLAAVGRIQVLKRNHYGAIAVRQQLETVPVPARRGSILDRHGVVLAASGGRSDYAERVYPLGEACCHVVGFVGKDLQGLAGVELAMDSLLRATPGRQAVFRDGRGHRRLFSGNVLRAPRHGCDVRLTLDATYQCLLARELSTSVTSVRARAACAVMMDPWRGDVLAMVSYPGYDAGRAVTPSRGLGYPADNYANRAITCVFEPGSSFKVFTAAAALDAGVVAPGTVIDCENGSYVVGSRTIHDLHPHGRLTFAEVLAYSSNTGTAKVAERLGSQRLLEKARLFGFGSKTGVPLSGESPGLLRGLAHWSKYSLVSVSFGHEVAVTAMQMARAVAAVANGGRLMKPRLIDEVTTRSGAVVESYPPSELHRVVSAATCVTLSKLLVEAVEVGTGRGAAVGGISVAGKTGTAQKFANGKPAGYVSTFVGFAPAEHPVFVLVLVIDEPQEDHLGGVVCAPVFRRVLTKMLTSPGGCLFAPLARAAARESQYLRRSWASAGSGRPFPNVG